MNNTTNGKFLGSHSGVFVSEDGVEHKFVKVYYSVDMSDKDGWSGAAVYTATYNPDKVYVNLLPDHMYEFVINYSIRYKKYHLVSAVELK